MSKNITGFNNINDYLPLFNAVLITDLFVIFLLNSKVFESHVLRQWYSQYNLSAVIADILIIFIVLIITILFLQLINQIIKLNYYFIIVNNYYNKNRYVKCLI